MKKGLLINLPASLLEIFSSKFFKGIQYIVCLSLFILVAQASFAQDDDDDPDMPKFAKTKLSKEEFMKLRSDAINMRRGVEKNKPFDPSKRIQAVQQMQQQKIQLSSQTQSPQINALISASWTELGPKPIPNGQVQSGSQLPVSGRTISIAVHPTNPNLVYVGTAQGGLYRSTDGGATWVPLMDHAKSLAIGAIAISPSQPETIYVGTGEQSFSSDSYFGVGVYRIDNASSANPVITGPLNKDASNADVFTGRAVSQIQVNPTNADIIFVSTTSGVGGIGPTTPGVLPNRGIYRSTNATSASPVFSQIGVLAAPNNNFSVRDIVLDPLNPNLLVANLVVGNGGIYRSTNALSPSPTFTNVYTMINGTGGTNNTTAEFAIQHTVGAPNPTIYAATGNNASGTGAGSLLISVDGGATWTRQNPLTFCNPQCFYNIAVAVDPGNPAKVYLGGTGATTFAYSGNNGTSFTSSQSGLHTDTHVITVAPSLTTTIYFGSDGGIYKSVDAGLTWSSLNNSTFRATQFTGLSLHPIDPNFSIGGTQDNGTEFYKPDGTWFRADFGDGGYSLIDQNATNTTTVDMYHTYFNASNLCAYAYVPSSASATEGNWQVRGCNGGATANGITCTATVNFYAPLAQGPGNPNTVYYGADRLYRSADKGLNHTTVSQTFTSPISAIGISKQNDNVRIIGQNNGGLFGTTTGATPLVNLDPTNTVPNNFIARAVIDPNDVNTAYVTLSAFGVVNIWKSSNLNNATPTWTAVATGIPQVPVNAFVVDPANSNNLFAGTDIGVFASTDAGASWVPFGTGLPVVAVFDMAIHPVSHVLRIATHGRGMWEIPLNVPAVTTYYVDDNDNTNDIYTPAATGNDATGDGSVTAPYRTITKALSVAPAGSTIFVDAGLFTEQVVVNQSMTITGAASSGVSQTTIKAPASLSLASPAPNGNNHKVIVYATGAGNTINISKVAIDGDGRGGGADQFEGVYYFEAGGSFSDSRIIKIRDASFSGVQSGIAFFANHTYDASLAQTVTVNNNSITDYQKAGIVINELNTQGIVTNNIVTGQNIENVNGQNGIQFGFGSYGTITGNTVTNNTYNGVSTDDAAGILIVGVGVDASDAPTGTSTTIGGAGTLANIINGNEVGLLTDAGGFGYDHNAGVTYGANSFANNLVHVYHDHPASVPSASFTYDKRVDNTSQTNIVYGQIQRAVNDATAGNILNASAGTFIEQVEIPKALTLNGAGVGLTNINSPAVLALSYTIPPSGTIHKPIVYVHDAAGVIFKNITVNGLGNGGANNRFQGIAYRNAGGTIQDCEVKAIRNNPLDGVQAGVSVYASATDGNARVLNVIHNSLTDFQKNGTVFSGANLTVNFDNNTVTGAGSTNQIAQNGVQVSGGAGGTVTNNVISGMNFTPNTAVSTGVIVFGPGSVQTSGNTVNDAQAGIYYIDASGSIANNIVNVTAANMGATPYWYGIVAENGTVSVTGNEVNGGGNGAGIEADAVSGETTTLTATNNKVANTDEGFVIFEDGSGVANSTINNNSITGSVSKAIHNYGATNSNATCNWYGTIDPAIVATKIAGPVTYSPFLNDGTDTQPAVRGFQPAAGTCAPATKLYVNDGSTSGDHYTTAIGNDATGSGSPSAPFATIGHAISLAHAGDTIYVDAGTYAGSTGPDKQLTFFGSNATISPNTGSRVAESILTDPQAFRISTTSKVVIQGFKLTTVAGNPIDNYTTNAKIALEKNLFDGSQGLFFANADTLNVFDNRFNDLDDNTSEGIQVAGNYNGTTGTYMDVHDNTWITGQASGMNISNAKGIIYNNTFQNIAYYGVLVANACNLDIYQNNFTGITNPGLGSPTWGAGVRFYTPGPGLVANIHNNYFTNNYIGVGVRNVGGDGSLAGTTVHVNNNSFTGSTDANIKNQAAQTLEANCNWYGSADPAVIAPKIVGPVNYVPFLTNGTDNSGAPGFQPVPNSCNGTLICESPAAQAYAANTQTGNQSHRGELGMQFLVNAPGGIIISQLGAFDDGGNGITGLQPGGGVRVAVYNRSNHTIVPGLDVTISGMGDAYTGNHQMKNITPVTLPQGDYEIVAKGYSAAERNGNAGLGGGPYPVDNGGGAITFGNEFAYGPDDPAGFTYPGSTGVGTGHEFLAGTLKFTTIVPCAGSSNCESAAAQAYTSSTSTGNQAHRGELGMQFMVNNPSGIVIKQLGAFDDGANGITGLQPGSGVRVVIFNRSTHAIVPGLDATISGLADGISGNHRMKNITPVTLPPGDYIIVAKGYNAGERNGNAGNGGGPYPVGNTNGGAITFANESSYGPDDPNGFNYPTSAVDFGNSHEFLAGTFNYTKVVPCTGSNADLSNLVLSQGTLTPAFASGTTSYTASVANSITSLTVTPTAAAAGSTITVNGTPVTSGSPSGPIALAVGSNIITVVVTASDGTTMKTYTVNVTRAPAPGCESAPAQAYTSNTQTGNQAHRGELGMEFIVNNPAGIIIKQLGAFDDLGNGITGLQPGGGVRVAIFNRSTHTVVPGLDVTISGLADAYTGNHRMKDIAPVTLPAGDYVIVAKGYHAGERNGNAGVDGGPYPAGNTGGGAISFGAISSYGPDDPNGFNYPNTDVNFGDSHEFLAGTFNFTTAVSCGGPSTNANLSNLVISQGILTPAFTSGTINYTASVDNSVTSLTVTPTAADAGATIKVNGTPVASGTPSGSIALAVGSNIITVLVTAQDGSTTKTYTINVTRAAAGGCESAPAQAYTSTTQLGNQAHRGELGMRFIVNNANGIIIKQLGAFDDGGNGLTGLQSGDGIRVAVFNRTTHAIVPGLDVIITGMADAYTGNHRMKNITPVNLPPGDYVIVAKGYNGFEKNGNAGNGGGPYPAGNTGGGAITYSTESSFGPDDPNGFSYPGTAVDFGDAHEFLAGTFNFTVNLGCSIATLPIAATKGAGTESSSQEGLITQIKDLQVYPNPTKGQFNLQIPDVSGSRISIQLINASGRIVEQRSVEGTTKVSSLVVPFNLVNLPSGTYLIKVESARGIQTKKFVIQR